MEVAAQIIKRSAGLFVMHHLYQTIIFDHLQLLLYLNLIFKKQNCRIYKKIARQARLDQSEIEEVSSHFIRVGTTQDLLDPAPAF